MWDSKVIIDLTHSMTSNMPVFPGDKPEPLFRKKTVLKEKDIQITTTVMHLGSHFGTHMDSPRHFFADKTPLDAENPGKFIGNAYKIDCPVQIGDAIELSAETMRKIKELTPEWVLFHTGWSERWNRESYFMQFPYLSSDTASFMVNSGIKGIGIDTPSVDAENADLDNYPIHRILLSADILIVENLTNLEKLPEGIFSFIALPLKITESDGSPCRAIAFQ